MNKEPLNPTVKHNDTTMAVVTNAVNAGKFDRDYANALLNLGNDKDTVNTIRDMVKSSPINPKNLEGVHPTIVKLTPKSYDDLGSGNLSILKQHAPEIYKAKFFEKNDRLPAEKDGKPL